MSKQSMTVIVKDDSGAEAEKNTAQANFINLISGILLIALGATALYFLIKIVWAPVVFIFQMIAFILFLVDIKILWTQDYKKTQEFAESGKTWRDLSHSFLGKKDVANCDEAELKDVHETLSSVILAGTVLTSFLWIAPLTFGLTEKYQVFPLNILAIIATIVGMWAWKSTTTKASVYTKKHIDEKVVMPNKWSRLKYWLVATPLTVYAVFLGVYAISDSFGFDVISFITNLITSTPK